MTEVSWSTIREALNSYGREVALRLNDGTICHRLHYSIRYMPNELPADLLTGHRKIDADHLKMYVGIRRLVSSVESSEDRVEWERQLNNLIATTWAHFAYEEKVMSHQKDGAHVFLHQMEHVKLIEDLMHVKERLANESSEQLFNLCDPLDNWLRDHINNFDRKLVALLVPADPILITDIPLF